jgi:hypothetical protein
LRDYHEGGLWHSERGTFINYTDYNRSTHMSPRMQTWGRQPNDRGIARTEFALYETVIPIWLGLLDDPQRIRGAFAWIDRHYTYASGRGGVTFPPYIGQNFVALMDVCVRQRYGIPGADRLLQLILDHALDGGIPLTEREFGGYASSGAEFPDRPFKFYPFTHSGRIWDNAPYFALVLNLHYGLDYDARGWTLSTPRPLGDYPLTEVKNLRHRQARYDIRWSGRGAIRHVRLDGHELTEPRLDLTDGEHTVEVELG